MQIKTQPFKEAIEIKNTGIAFDVYGSGAKRIGDLAVTKNGLIWSNGGTTHRAKGVAVKWDDFITWMQSQTQTRAQTPARAAQPQARPLASAQTRTAPKAKIAAKPATKPVIKIAASAKTAQKKAH
jgi:hypothetical protein